MSEFHYVYVTDFVGVVTLDPFNNDILRTALGKRNDAAFADLTGRAAKVSQPCVTSNEARFSGHFLLVCHHD